MHVNQKVSSDIAHRRAARERLRAREQQRSREEAERQGRAAMDARAIVQMLAANYQPRRIYQWGSVLKPDGFRAYSDLDIAVEGVTDAESFFRMLGEAQAMTSFDLDLVQMEKIAPEYAEDIRRHGKVVYERP